MLAASCARFGACLGRKANVGIWSARDADHLNEALQSLPIWPLITLEVTPLATHPLFAEMAREVQG